jgi:hypothetical protein
VIVPVALVAGLVIFTPADSLAAGGSSSVEAHRGVPLCITVQLNSRNDFVFGFDSAASGDAWVAPSLVEQLRLPVVGQVQAHDASGRSVRSLDVVRIDSLTVDGVTFGPIRAPVVRHLEARCAAPVMGTLGLDLFAAHLLTVDLTAGSIRVARGELAPADGRKILTYRASLSMARVKIAIGSVRLEAGVDTGGQWGVMLPLSIARGLRFRKGSESLRRMRTLFGEFEVRRGRLAADLTIGEHRIHAPRAAFSGYFSEPLLGRQVLSRFILTFDQRHRRVRFVLREDGEATAGADRSSQRRVP